MSDRDIILQEIKKANQQRPAYTRMHISTEGITYTDKVQQFKNILTAIGGTVKECNTEAEAINEIQHTVPAHEQCVIVNRQEKIEDSKEAMYAIHTACIKGSVAVAENGAVWIDEINIGNRILPFSCLHLNILLSANAIVNNMHEAYQQIQIENNGYGVFIAGPSKTADIEQSLVIGAHGPLSLTVYLIKN